MLLKWRSVCGNQERYRDQKEVEALRSLSCMQREPIPGMVTGLLRYFVRVAWFRGLPSMVHARSGVSLITPEFIGRFHRLVQIQF